MKIYWISLGCPRNWVDTEAMIDFCKRAGHSISKTLEEADLCVVNTCGFLQESREESLAMIKHVLKTGKRVVVTGCMVFRHKNLIQEAFFNQVHQILGPGELDQIADLVSSTKPLVIPSNKQSFLNAPSPRFFATPKHYAYVKISEGCRKQCSFCIIPKIKGKLQSKPKEKIIQEIEELLSQDVKEIILVGQDLLDYGKDFQNSKEGCLVSLLKEILQKTEKKFWLRLLYIYPDHVPLELFDLMAKDPRLCAYLDLPLQHVSDKILKLMDRKTSHESILKLLDQARQKVPHIAIRSSFIVGFPHETEKEFQNLCDFVEQQKLDQVGVFCFSKEPLAKASTFSAQVPKRIKEERKKILLKIQEEVVEKKNKKLVGKTFEVLVESLHPESPFLAMARTYAQAPEIDNMVVLNDLESIEKWGEFQKVKIQNVLGLDLLGKIKN